MLSSQLGAALGAASYTELGGASAALAQLEAARFTLEGKLAKATDEAVEFERKVESETAATRVLSLRVSKLRSELAEQGTRPATRAQGPSARRPCPACRASVRLDEFEGHVTRCVTRAVEFSVARATRRR